MYRFVSFIVILAFVSMLLYFHIEHGHHHSWVILPHQDKVLSQ